MIIIYFMMSLISSIFLIFTVLLISKYFIYLLKKYILGIKNKKYKKVKFQVYKEIFENTLIEKYVVKKIKK